MHHQSPTSRCRQVCSGSSERQKASAPETLQGKRARCSHRRQKGATPHIGTCRRCRCSIRRSISRARPISHAAASPDPTFPKKNRAHSETSRCKAQRLARRDLRGRRSRKLSSRKGFGMERVSKNRGPCVEIQNTAYPCGLNSFSGESSVFLPKSAFHPEWPVSPGIFREWTRGDRPD
jgi:hypothetical protein